MKRAIAAVAALAVAIVAFYTFHRRARAHEEPALRVVHVPRATEATKIDGELDEAMWRTAAREIFVGRDGANARPYSDVRLAWSGGVLHVGLYASDKDIVTARVAPDGPVWRGDAFHLVVKTNGKSWSFDVDARCTLTDGARMKSGAWDYSWQSGARLACDADGTIDTPGDNDEEWVVEMDIPLAAIGLEGKSGERAELSVRRCDSPSTGGDAACPQIAPIAIVLD